MQLIQRLNEQFFTELFRNRGLTVTVSSVSASPVGTGQMADTYRFQLDYSSGDKQAPKSLIGKVASADPDSVKLGMDQGYYANEIRFYQQLAGKTSIALPHCYHAEIDGENGQFTLILEDLSPAVQGDQMQAISLPQTELALVEAAKLHAAFWQAKGLENCDWLDHASPAALNKNNQAAQQCWQLFRQRNAQLMSSETINTADRYFNALSHRSFNVEGPTCLTHFDFRPDNMLFASEEGGRPISIVDWQTLNISTPANDVAYLLASALEPDTRRQHETQLLHTYLDALSTNGVNELGIEELLKGYRAGGVRLLRTAAMAGVAVKRTERGDKLFCRMASLATEHMKDHHLLD